MKQSLEQDERDERSGVPQACCLELDHGLSLERGKRWFTDFFQVLAELQQDLVLDEVSHALLQHQRDKVFVRLILLVAVSGKNTSSGFQA